MAFLGKPQEIIYPQRCDGSLTEPLARPKVSNISGDLRSAVSAGSQILAERGMRKATQGALSRPWALM